jgi:threonine/homoserine/homoserine lactone efflux protein
MSVVAGMCATVSAAAAGGGFELLAGLGQAPFDGWFAAARLFLSGLVVGFFLAMPVGPVAALCVTATLTRGRLHGVCVGVGAALADVLLSSTAIFGLASLSSLLLGHSHTLKLVGIAVLVVVGVRTIWLARGDVEPPAAPSAGLDALAVSATGPIDLDAVAVARPRLRKRKLAALIGTSFVLTLTNPIALFAFAGLFGVLGVVSGEGLSSRSLLAVAGVFSGSLSWFIVMVTLASVMRRILGGGALARLQVGIGVALLGLAGVLAVSLVRPQWLPFSEGAMMEAGVKMMGGATHGGEPAEAAPAREDP